MHRQLFKHYLFKVSSTYAPMASTLAHDGRPNSTILYPSFQELVLCLIWYVWFGGELGGEQRFWSGKGDFDFFEKNLFPKRSYLLPIYHILTHLSIKSGFVY